ncbi:MAG: DUF3626 domain-containing protein [Patescibacteria group bacterium]
MPEVLEKKIKHAKGAESPELPKKESSLEEDMAEFDLMLEDSKTDLDEFVSSGLPMAEIIASEMEGEVDQETKTALAELNKQAELARQILADSLVGKIRLKSADLLKKYLPGSKLTSLAEEKNAEIVSKITAERLHEFLSVDLRVAGLDYKDADKALEYFEKHKDLLVGEDRKKLEIEVLEAVKIHEQRKAEALSEKTVEELRKFLEFDYLKHDYKDAEQAADYFEKHKDLLVGDDRENLEKEVLEAIRIRKLRESGLSTEKIVEELEELLKEDDGDCKQVAKAVDYFLKFKDQIADEKRQSIEERIFNALKYHLINVAGFYHDETEGLLENALTEYKNIPNEFLKDKDISGIGAHIYSKMTRGAVDSEKIMAAFDGNLDLLASGSKYQNSYDYFSSKDKIRIVEETYKKRGASEYIAKYTAEDFEDQDFEKVLKPLFESYKKHNNRAILSQMGIMKDMYDSMPLDERDQLNGSLIQYNSNEVFAKFDELNLSEFHKAYLIDRLMSDQNYKVLHSEDNLKKLGANKDEIFAKLLNYDAANLFANREAFKPSSEQNRLLLEKATSSPEKLEKTLSAMKSLSSSTELTEEELKIFKKIVKKDAPYLIHKFRTIFKEEFKEQEEFFKELPSGLFENGLEGFIRQAVNYPGGWEKNAERIKALVIEAGEHKVTNEYFEQLESSGLKLPNRVLGKIKENIKKTEQKNLFDYFKYALNKNATLEQVQREAQQGLEATTNNADYFKAVYPSVLKEILAAGRFKTQFETHSSNGTLNPRYRAEQENKMFNYVVDENKGETVRPNYGYMSDNENGIVGSFDENNVHSKVSRYGNIHVKFKKEQVADRTTVTFDDSLSPADENPPTPSIKPHFSSLGKRHDPRLIKQASKPQDWGANYLEAQFHWPLRTSLIESIHISEKNSMSKEVMLEVEEMVNEYNGKNANNIIKIVVY